MDSQITLLLAEARAGNSEAESRVAALVYDELHRLAARCMRGENQDLTVQTTVLVHDAFLRLVDQRERTWENRAHFFAVAAQVMRRLLIDYARERRALKRGGRQQRVDLDALAGVSPDVCEEWLAVDQALQRLSARDPELGRLVELRFFGGLSEDEIATVMGVSTRTVKRHWRVAKAWLRGELSSAESDDAAAMGKSKASHG